MPELFFIVANVIATFPGLELIAVALEEILISMSGGDWGCGATAQLFFNGDDVKACEWINSLPDMTEPA